MQNTRTRRQSVAATRPTTATEGTTLRVVVAGGRQLLRDGIRALLEDRDDVQVVGSVDDALAARAAIATGEADLVVAHAYLGDAAGGAALAVVLREESPETGVVLLLGDGDAREVDAVLDQGTQRRALLLMDHPRCAEELPRAIHEVAAGGSVVHPGVVELILRARRSPASDPLALLTPRERQVLEGIASGSSNRGIAAELGMSERAVEKHINQLYAKLDLPADGDVHRRVAAAIRYLSSAGD